MTMNRLGPAILAAAALLCAAATARAAEPPDPSVRLFDTGTQAPFGVLSERDFTDRKGWTQIPEGNLDHKFSNDVVLMNDKLAVVLPKRRDGVWLHASSARGYDRQVLLQPWPCVGAFQTVQIIQNDPAAVDIKVNYPAQSGQFLCHFRMTAGEPTVEIRSGEGMTHLALRDLPARPGHSVVPDFFGDDAAFTDLHPLDPPVRLPAENLLLRMGDSFSSMLMCVWESSAPAALMFIPDEASAPAVTGFLIECAKDKRLWVASLEAPRLWQHHTVAGSESPRDFLRRFKPPFPAKWRADFVGLGGVCDSVTFEQPPDAAPVPETWRGPVLIYPIDRSRTTPLTTLLPIDVLRSTLGVGPCQYILALEGLASDEPPTPAAVTEWVEKQFKRKRGAASAEEIKARLDAMLNHLAAARARIDDYAAFGRQVRAACQGAAKEPADAEDAKALLAICDRLDHDLARGRKEMKTPEEAAGLARAIGALVAAPDAAAKCGPPGAALSDIGHAQDATLARSRMAARRVREHCRTSETEFARKIRAMAEGMLRKK